MGMNFEINCTGTPLKMNIISQIIMYKSFPIPNSSVELSETPRRGRAAYTYFVVVAGKKIKCVRERVLVNFRRFCCII